MRVFAEEFRSANFAWLIEHDGWEALPVPPGEDVQGLDVRQWIRKDGVVFSAYSIPRGTVPDEFSTVDLDPLPQWAQSLGLTCAISVPDLVAKLGLDAAPDGAFRLLNAHLGEVRAYLESANFARAVLHRHIAYLRMRYELDRDVLRDLRPQVGRLEMMRGLLLNSVSERVHLARYRRALRSLPPA